ncbi:MAG: hemolysin family protein [Spirochaetes bacterium]|nr:hemolysin family protein [Spirochaetota bacterium]
MSYQFIILGILIILSAFFSGTETAFTSLSKIRIQHLLEQKKKGIKLVKALKDENERLIITILIGNNLVNIAASSIATSIAIEVLESNGIGVAIGLMTMIILIAGEIFPKTIAISKNEFIAINSAPVIQLLQFVLFPLIKFLEIIVYSVSLPFRKEVTKPIITEAEIKSVVRLGAHAGEVEEDELEMIQNIFRFSDMKVREIMTDRSQIYAIDVNLEIDEVCDELIQKGFSRIPVFKEKNDNIVGILYTKDLLQAIIKKDKNISIENIMRTPVFIPETMLLDNMLKEFQQEKVHIALVVDEHGGISGLVTIEDLLEEIVGDIIDETDKEKVFIKKVSKNKYIVKAETEIEIINKELGLKLDEKADYETIAGFVLSKLKYIPKADEEITLNNYIIRVTKANNKRIIELEIIKKYR